MHLNPILNIIPFLALVAAYLICMWYLGEAMLVMRNYKDDSEIQKKGMKVIKEMLFIATGAELVVGLVLYIITGSLK